MQEVQDFTLNTKKLKTKFLTAISFLNFYGQMKSDNNKYINGILISDRDSERVGKIEQYNNGQVKRFIKTVHYGNPGEFLTNPFEHVVTAAYTETDTRSKQYRYTEVTHEAFVLYRKFLITRNQAYFTGIERMAKQTYKRGKISEAESIIILNGSLSFKQLSEVLNRSVASIEKYYNENTKEIPVIDPVREKALSIPDPPPEKEHGHARKYFERGGNKETQIPGISIMTEASSQMADEFHEETHDGLLPMSSKFRNGVTKAR